MSLYLNIIENIPTIDGIFYIFAGMGIGQNSGKLQFRDIVSSDGSISLIDGTFSMTFSTYILPSEIDYKEISYGNSASTGITSSVFFVKDDFGYTSIFGANNISKNTNPYSVQDGNIAVSSYSYINGLGNVSISSKSSIYNSNNIVSIGNYIINTNYIYKNTIIGVDNSTACQSTGTVMIGGVSNCSTNSRYSLISGGNYNYIDTDYGLANGRSIIGSVYSHIDGQIGKFSTILGSLRSIISNQNPASGICPDFNFLIGIDSQIIGGLPGITLGSKNSSIISGLSSTVNNAWYSSILGGSSNIISSVLNDSVNVGIAKNSTIIVGNDNCIYSPPYEISNSYQLLISNSTRSIIKIGCASSIFSSSKAIIYNSYLSTILSSGGGSYYTSNTFNLASDSCLTANTRNSSIITSPTSVLGADNSLTISSENSQNYGNNSFIRSFNSCIMGDNNVIIGSKYSCTFNSNSSIIGGYFNVQSSTSSVMISSQGSTSSNSINSSLITSLNGLIIDSESSSIISGVRNSIINSINSVIIGGNNNTIRDNAGKVCNSVILGGSNINLEDSNTVGVDCLQYSKIRIVGATQSFNSFSGTYSMVGTLYIRNGIITQN